MPRLVNATPKYRRHKASGQAVVTIDGRDFYLGLHGSNVSRIEYDRVVGEWLAAGRRLPTEIPANSITIVELAAAYWRFAESYYTKNGQPTGSIERIKTALKHLRATYGLTLTSAFGPLALQALQLKFVQQGKARTYVNHLIEQIKRIFKWGVAKELVPPSVYQALSTVDGLRRGRTEATERQPIGPVAPEIVDATLPFLPPVVADMVRFQSLTGCRPGEVCILRPADLDRAGDVWAYRPSTHKTEHRGRERVIFIGPLAQEILRPYLLPDAGSYCFTPAESERKRLAARHAVRKTPASYGNKPGSNRKKRRKLPPGDHYETGAYANCIRRASDIADRAARKKVRERDVNAEDKRLIPRWTPNQLRHSVATNVRRRFGLEAVQVVLGHAKADVSQIYAERDMGLAERIMREVG
jgi:integrase